MITRSGRWPAAHARGHWRCNEGSDMAEDGLGGKFWLMFIGGAIACAFAGLLFFLVLGNAWARWGFFGMFLFLAVLALVVGWIMDHRTKSRYDTLG